VNHETVWTQERIERLEELWAGGHSAGVVAREFGVTRSAVIGKVSRLKLAKRPTQRRLDVDPEKIAAMHNEGMRVADIAQALGVSQRTVVRYSPPRPMVCAWCSAPFEKKPGGRRPCRYCCDECRRNAKTRMSREARARRRLRRKEAVSSADGAAAL